jgi:thymidylate synthase ThyX
MPRKRQVYLLDPQILPPETIAVTFAKTSRSPKTFREIASELTDEKSAEFHEKWVVGYGHASVAEHAVLHIAVENISRLAVECLESNRLASYTEKSTRYQKWDQDSFYIPDEIKDQKLRQEFIDTNRFLFQTYRESLPVVQNVIAGNYPRKENESEAAWERRIRSLYVDVSRFILPAAALANVGVTINARTLEHALRKMLSHPLQEVREIGEEIKAVSRENVPTLVKYANPVDYWVSVAENFKQEATEITPGHQRNDWCQLVDYDSAAEKRVLAAMLYRFGQAEYQQVWNFIQQCSPEKISQLACLLTKDIGRFDIPVRELEYANFTFDLIMDQGAYFEIKRHRMMTQTPQLLSTEIGYALPKSIVDAGFGNQFHKAMNAAHLTFKKLVDEYPGVASYIVPNAFNRRVLIQSNLRSLDHLISLRAAPNAHFSVRRVAHRMAEEVFSVCNLAKYWVRDEITETWQDVEKQYFAETNHSPGF